ncbi:Aminomethyltransferase [Pseudomonas syringae pv. tomato]|uniref:Aminomethyltransferase n=1 Tax=Pseudomonas syringae pv. maculicola TaxID=59511 RepID=A0A3M3A169_PSEYM|nr:Aminomethyltransferase [Pseudomonas syringae pv. tomato]RML94236.1 Aminomethyltransferase [Pseudomonas syringae pv. maculicola]
MRRNWCGLSDYSVSCNVLQTPVYWGLADIFCPHLRHARKEKPMGQRTPLFDLHLALGAKMVDFGGWDMPLHYGSQVEEHHQVRRDCGVFDVSHMNVIDVLGREAKAWLRRLLANDVDKLKTPGRALYSAMLDEQAGVIDDMIVYLTADGYRLVVNAATGAKDLAWMQSQLGDFDVQLLARSEMAMLAIQGPQARNRIAQLVSSARAELIRQLKPFEGLDDGDWFIARTGYTGEDGLEIMLPADEAQRFFNELVGAGISPIGLGARDTLRLEAGMNLYGQDIGEHVSPLASNMAWSIAWEPAERDFIGRQALESERAEGTAFKLVGLVLEERGVLRAHQVVRVAEIGEGEITSGSFSPTLSKSIALARVPMATADRAEVEIRGKWYPVRVVQPAFVRHGKTLI